jgi:hypothetical protein
MDPNQHHDRSEHDDESADMRTYDYFLVGRAVLFHACDPHLTIKEPHRPSANYSQHFYNDRPNSFVYAPHVQTATGINEPYQNVPPMPLGRPFFQIPSRGQTTSFFFNSRAYNVVGIIGLPRSHHSPEIVTSNMSTEASFNVPIQDSQLHQRLFDVHSNGVDYDPRNILSQNVVSDFQKDKHGPR